MATHISSIQLLDHIKTATSLSVDGKITKNFSIDSDNLMVDALKFPIKYFDIGGMTPHSVYLMDETQTLHEIMMLDVSGVKLDHPEWVIEPYDPSKIKHGHLLK